MSGRMCSCIECMPYDPPEEDLNMMDQKPPKPDALLTIVDQLEQLHDEWGRAAEAVSRAGAAGPGPFAQGQRDVWLQAQKQIAYLVESIKAARRSGIYVTDAQQQLIALIEQRHKDTIEFLRILSQRIYASLLPPKLPEEPTDGTPEATGAAESTDTAL